MYITLEDYKAIYDPIDERLFNNLAFEACRVMDIHTTGIDNIKKLKVAFPAEPDYAETVKRCAAKLVNLMYQIQQAEIAAIENRGYDMTEQGLRGKVISSVSAGNESITYSASATSTAIDAAVKSRTERDKLFANTVWYYLSGVEDANGVNLLYMGRYPRRFVC